MDSLSSAIIKEKLKYDFEVSVLKEIDSTSTYLLSVADENTRNGTAVFSEMQTNGRGRRGKSFFSPDKTGLYFSFLLRPEKDFTPAEITLTAAVSVTLALEKLLGVTPKIKWVNDIFLDGKKVCGILAERHQREKEVFYILGVGVNVYRPENDFPHEIKETAGYILPSERENFKSYLASEIINEFFYLHKSDFSVILKEYSSRLLGVGKEIKVLCNCPYSAVLRGINKNGELIVTKENGEEALLSSGEISIVL